MKFRIDIVLGAMVLLLAWLAVTGYAEWQDARASYLETLSEQRELEAEAALLNISALTKQRDSLANGDGGTSVPLANVVEGKISEIAALIADSGMVLGPFVTGQVSVTVENSDIGLSSDSPTARSYGGIELSLSLDGDVEGLLGLSDRILANVREATFSDIVISQSTAADDASLSLRVLLYHQPSEG